MTDQLWTTLFDEKVQRLRSMYNAGVERERGAMLSRLECVIASSALTNTKGNHGRGGAFKYLKGIHDPAEQKAVADLLSTATLDQILPLFEQYTFPELAEKLGYGIATLRNVRYNFKNTRNGYSAAKLIHWMYQNNYLTPSQSSRVIQSIPDNREQQPHPESK